MFEQMQMLNLKQFLISWMLKVWLVIRWKATCRYTFLFLFLWNFLWHRYFGFMVC